MLRNKKCLPLTAPCALFVLALWYYSNNKLSSLFCHFTSTKDEKKRSKEKAYLFPSFLLSIVRRGKFHRDRRRDEDFLSPWRALSTNDVAWRRQDWWDESQWKELLSALNKKDEFEAFIKALSVSLILSLKSFSNLNPISTRHTKLSIEAASSTLTKMRNPNISIFIKSFRAREKFSIFPHDDNGTTLTMSMAQYWSEEPAWHDVVPERLFIIILCYFSRFFLFHSSDYEKGFSRKVQLHIFLHLLQHWINIFLHLAKLPQAFSCRLQLTSWWDGFVLKFNLGDEDWPNIQI